MKKYTTFATVKRNTVVLTQNLKLMRSSSVGRAHLALKEKNDLGKLCKFNEKCGNSSVGRAQPCQGWGREFEPRFPLKGRICRCPGGGMVDALVSGASVERRAGSSPVLGTKLFYIIMEEWRNW